MGEVTIMFLLCLNEPASLSSAGLKPCRCCSLRGTKPSRIRGMCSRLQKHSDWWVWITEQTVHTSLSPPTSPPPVFHFVLRGFQLLTLSHKVLTHIGGELFAHVLQFSLNGLFVLLNELKEMWLPNWKSLVVQPLSALFFFFLEGGVSEMSPIWCLSLLTVICGTGGQQKPLINTKA